MHLPKYKYNSAVIQVYKIEQYMQEILYTQRYIKLQSYLQQLFFLLSPHKS